MKRGKRRHCNGKKPNEYLHHPYHPHHHHHPTANIDKKIQLITVTCMYTYKNSPLQHKTFTYVEITNSSTSSTSTPLIVIIVILLGQGGEYQKSG